MFCSISGSVPEDPVISKKSGHIFERSLIEKYIDNTGKCPVTGDDLEKDDLLSVQSNKIAKPRPIGATSLPAMLSLFQNEWDAVMLETYTLKQHLDSVRQELAHALYQQDAACRVIARLVRERDEARMALSQVRAGGANGVEADKQAALDAILANEPKLSKERKGRKASPSLASVDDVKNYSATKSVPMHKSTQPGVLCVDIDPKDENQIVTGGVDGKAIVYNSKTGKNAATLSGHTKKVVDVAFHPTADVVFTASHDGSARVWSKEGNGFSTQHSLSVHNGAVNSLSVNAVPSYIATGSDDKSWALHDIVKGVTLGQYFDPKAEEDKPCSVQTVAFHPDGVLLATGTTGMEARVWELKSGANVATFKGHTGSITDVAFSENGYFCATASDDKTVKLWDLRKVKTIKTINVDSAVNGVVFDYSGKYLGIVSDDVRIYNYTKAWDIVQTWSDNSGAVTDFAFGTNAHFFVTTSMDRSLKLYSSA